MIVEMKVPTVGESITEVTVAQWLKKDGEFVEMDEIICELESDKATFELTAEKSGVLKIEANEGDTIEIGSLICKIDTDSKVPNESNLEKESSSSSNKTGEIIEMNVPTVGESITEVTIGNWLKANGDFVKLDEILAEIESDKATFDLTAEATGYLKIIAEEGTTLDIGALVCKIEVAEGDSPPITLTSTSKDDTQARETPSQVHGYAEGHPSPAAQKILSEKGIDPATVKGSGIRGRITKEDAEAAQKTTPIPKAAPVISSTKTTAKPSGNRGERRNKMTNLRKTIAKRLVSVKNETAMLTTFNEVDMKPVMDIRKKYKEIFKEKHEVGLGFMSFFTKASCMALQEWSAVNARIEAEEIVYNDYCDISIAVSTPKGLVVPVVRNAETMDFHEIEKEIIKLAIKAKEGKLGIDEMQGGTFTITNGGIFGSMLSTPIINAPQSAILGMHNILQRPVAIDGAVVIRPIMYLALSYDHRIVDGRESVSFLKRVKELLEDPTRLLIGV